MRRVIVGMSGGVDSAVAASVLKEQGYNVEALFMKNWEEDSEYCTAEQDYNDALQVCDKLEVPLHTVNFVKEYWENVFEHFLEEYKVGRTPNPDILCNNEIKFKRFLDYAFELGADKIATGHYVRSEKKNGKVKLIKGADSKKDQSYFLHGLNQKQVSNSIFPIGGYVKSEIRKMAEELGFNNFKKKDSVGICFIGERKMKEFLKKYLPANPGEIITSKGESVGEHDGLMYYTIGQRKGLGVGGGHSDLDAPWYVIEKDLLNNQLIVAQGRNNSALYHKHLKASNLHWVLGSPPKKDRFNAKVRYRANDVPCKINDMSNTNISIEFDQACFGIAPGQSIVFYDGEVCLGGAVIDSFSN